MQLATETVFFVILILNKAVVTKEFILVKVNIKLQCITVIKVTAFLIENVMTCHKALEFSTI